MSVFLGVVIGLVVGAVCGYAFRGWIHREVTTVGGDVKKHL